MITEILKNDYNDKDGERDPLTGKIIEACFHVHSQLGPGFVERIDMNALIIALKERDIQFLTEKNFNVSYKGKSVGRFRADLVVEDRVIVELKAVEGRMPRLFESQAISYLKASDIKVGLLVNFGNKSCEVRRLMR